MSLRKFLHKLWLGIRRIFEGIEAEVKKLVPIAIQVVENIKTFNDSVVADVLTHLIPGTIDDTIRAKLHDWLPKILLELNMIDSIANIEDPNEQLKAILAKIKMSSDSAQNVFYHGLASLIMEKLSDGKFSWSDAVAVSEYYYQHEFKPLEGTGTSDND